MANRAGDKAGRKGRRRGKRAGGKRAGAGALEDALRLHQAGRLDDAEYAYRKALAADAGAFVAHVNLGVVLNELGRAADAVRSYRLAIEIDPDVAEVHYALGLALQGAGEDAEAAGAFARACDIKPDYVEALNALAAAEQVRGDWDRAAELFERALAIRPDSPETLNNFGILLHRRGRLGDAEARLRQAIRIAPDYAEAHRNLSHVLLLQGRFADGWPAFRWRWKCRDFPSERRAFPQPPWQGEPLAGKTILVWGEQGVGDEVQFAGMVPDLVDAGAGVVLESDKRLVPLFGRSFPGVRCVARATPAAPEALGPDIDVQAPAGDLGRWLRPDFDSFPGRESYLAADASRRDALRVKYKAGGDDTLVGIAWISKNPEVGRDKSMALADWAPLAATPGVRFVDLQYGDTAAERRAFEAETGVAVLRDGDVDQIEDLDAFAAQVAAMDLVVSVSNTTAHLAGALGRPTWVLLHHLPLPVWMLERADSPWYPSLRLYRQAGPGDWAAVMGRVRADFEEFAAGRRGG